MYIVHFRAAPIHLRRLGAGPLTGGLASGPNPLAWVWASGPQPVQSKLIDWGQPSSQVQVSPGQQVKGFASSPSSTNLPLSIFMIE